MKQRGKLLALTLSAALALSGCGTAMYELSEDEENLIAMSAAQIVAKHNIAQKDGMNTTVPETETEDEAAQSVTVQETQQQDAQTGQETADTTESTEPETAEVTMDDIIQTESLSVTCKSKKLQDSYQEGSYFAVTPEEGYQLAVYSFSVKNIGEKTAKLDMTARGASFYLLLDGQQIGESVSFGEKGLSSYSGKIKAGKNVTTVLLFQVPDSYSGDLSEAQLQVLYDGAICNVKL